MPCHTTLRAVQAGGAAAALPTPPPSALVARRDIPALDPRLKGHNFLTLRISRGFPVALTVNIAGAPFRPRFLGLLRRSHLLCVSTPGTDTVHAANVSGVVGRRLHCL